MKYRKAVAAALQEMLRVPIFASWRTVCGASGIPLAVYPPRGVASGKEGAVHEGSEVTRKIRTAAAAMAAAISLGGLVSLACAAEPRAATPVPADAPVATDPAQAAADTTAPDAKAGTPPSRGAARNATADAAAATTSAPKDSGKATPTGKTPAVCFKLTMRCVEARKSPKEPAGGHDRPLNLNAPDIRTVVSPEDLKEPVASRDQQAQAEDDATVQVQAAPEAPDVPGGFGALWWALNHPSQAWRILAPVQ